MDKIKKTLKNILESGSIIYGYSIKENYIELLEGVDYKNDETIVTKYNGIDFTNLEDTLSSDLFKNALFNPIQRGILLVDIVGYSKGDTLWQAALLDLFNNGFKHAIKIQQIFSPMKIVEQIIPTGDGCYIIFNENLNNRFIRIALTLMSSIRAKENEYYGNRGLDPSKEDHMHLRIGALVGEVSFFNDIAGNRNCFGDGMNEVARILTYGQKEFEEKFSNDISYDCIYFGNNVKRQIEELIPPIMNLNPECKLISLGEVKDKHDRKREINIIKNLPDRMSFYLFSPEERDKINNNNFV